MKFQNFEVVGEDTHHGDAARNSNSEETRTVRKLELSEKTCISLRSLLPQSRSKDHFGDSP